MSDVSTSMQKAIATTSAVRPRPSCRRPTGNRTRSSNSYFRSSISWPRKTPRRMAGTSPTKGRRLQNSSARRCGDWYGIDLPLAVPREARFFDTKTTWTCPRARARPWRLVGVPASRGCQLWPSAGAFCSAEAAVFAISASAITDANSAIE